MLYTSTSNLDLNLSLNFNDFVIYIIPNIFVLFPICLIHNSKLCLY